jgi:Zn-dependent protease
VLGAPVLLAWSWFIAAGVIMLLFSPWIARVRPDLGSFSYVIGFVFAVVLFGSVFLHELAHAVAGRLAGYRVAAVELNIWGGFTRFEPREQADSPRSAWTSFTISVVGPVVNLALGGAGWLILSGLERGSVAWLLLFGFSLANLALARSTCCRASRWTAAGRCRRCSGGSPAVRSWGRSWPPGSAASSRWASSHGPSCSRS